MGTEIRTSCNGHLVGILLGDLLLQSAGSEDVALELETSNTIANLLTLSTRELEDRPSGCLVLHVCHDQQKL